MIYLIPLAALILPFILWVVELVLPYSYLIEEIAKGTLVFGIVKLTRKNSLRLKMVILSGILFSFSETVFYLFNINLVGNLTILISRLFLTTSFHALTMAVILIPALFSKKFIIVGVALAVLGHYLYNFYLVPYLFI